MSKKCIECPICEKIIEKYKLMSHFINHGFVKRDEIKKYHNNDEYYLQYRYHCNICGKEISSAKTYLVHWKRNHKELKMTLPKPKKNYTCDVCGAKVTLDGKEEHFRKFHLEYSFHHVKGVASSHIHCDICGKAVGSYKSLVKSHNHNMAHESDLTCDICGTKVPMDGKGDHFRKFHPEYYFHHTNGKYYCDICGKSVSGFKELIRAHNHIRMPVNPRVQRDSWLFDNYDNISTFYIDCLDKKKTREQFNISDYLVNEALYLAGLNEAVSPSYLKQFLNIKKINAIEITMKKEINNKKEIQQMENNANNEAQGISRDQIIGAIEEIIIENRQLKIRIKESSSISQEVLAGMNAELAKYKKIKEEDNGVISELNRQLELCRIAKERTELALRQKIAEGQKAMIVKISNQEEKQSIEERPY